MRLTIDVAAALDARPLGRYRLGVILCCFAVQILDGVDVNALAFVAPTLARQFHATPAEIGPIFGIGFFGMLIGNSLVGGLADRFGRKRLIVASCVVFGALTLGVAAAGSLRQLMVLRFLAGIGLGGALPNVVALTGAFAPRRLRGTAIGIIYSGIPLGSVIGGLVAAPLVPRFGWPVIFIVGGILPLIAAAVLARVMPESILFLAVVRKDAARVARLLRRIDPQGDYPEDAAYRVAEPRQDGVPVRRLFAEGRGRATLLLWSIVLADLLCLHFLFSWTTTILRQTGLPLATAILLSTLVAGSSVVCTFAVGPLMDRYGVYPVAIAQFSIGTFGLVLAGLAGPHLVVLVAAQIIASMMLASGPVSTGAMAVQLYPTAIRSTGIGWALGAGRSGSIIGPMLGGLVLAFAMPGLNPVYLVIAPFGLVAAIMTVILARQTRRAGRARPLHPASSTP